MEDRHLSYLDDKTKVRISERPIAIKELVLCCDGVNADRALGEDAPVIQRDDP